MINKKYFILGLSLCFLTLSLSGCAALRRKFIRKKKIKDNSQKFIPILEPIDYPAKIYSSQERYKQHYSLWQVWQKDLVQSIDRDESDKRQKYLLAQFKAQLDEMNKWITPEKQAELSIIINNIHDLERYWKKPRSMRNYFSIKKKIQLNIKKIRLNFKPALIEDNFI